MARMARLRFMKLLELLNAANQGYPDGYLAEYYDTKTGTRKRGRGDTLAEFIVLELIDTFDPKTDDDAQIGIGVKRGSDSSGASYAVAAKLIPAEKRERDERPAPLPIRRWAGPGAFRYCFHPACFDQRGRAGTESAFFMAIKEDDIIYVLTKEDVDGVAKSIGLSKLTDAHYRMARKYIENFCGDSAYDWENAISDALKEVEEKRQGKYSGPKPEK